MKKGFALVYVIIFVGIISITIASIASLGISDVRQARKALATDGAFQIAESGIEDGIANIQSNVGRVLDKDIFYNVSDDSYYVTRIPSDIADDHGDYWFKVTSTSGAYTVESIGYFKKSKVKMKADCNGEGKLCNIYQAGF